MNKYEEALQELHYQYYAKDKNVDLLIELVKRATPMKPYTTRKDSLNPTYKQHICSSCDYCFNEHFRFCPYCGQAIDWSEINETK